MPFDYFKMPKTFFFRFHFYKNMFKVGFSVYLLQPRHMNLNMLFFLIDKRYMLISIYLCNKFVDNFSIPLGLCLFGSLCILLRWGAMDAEAYPESSEKILKILWDIITSVFRDEDLQCAKARISALESLAQYEVSSIDAFFAFSHFYQYLVLYGILWFVNFLVTW